jgi:hypothetical protein
MEDVPSSADAILLGIVGFALAVALVNWGIDAVAHFSLRLRSWWGRRVRH